MGVPRIGLGPYMWLVEANTGANSACIGGPGNKCSTTFNGMLLLVQTLAPEVLLLTNFTCLGPLGMGASFNRTSW